MLTLRAEQPEALCGAGWAYAIERTGWDKAVGFLQRCKDLGTTSAQDKQMIEAKLQGIEAMRKNAQAQPATPEEKKAPTGVGGSGSMLEKVSDEAAQQEGVPAEGAAPAEGAPPEAGADSPTVEGEPAAEPSSEAPKTE